MLTLTRKVGESIRIGDDIVVIVKEIKGKQVRIGIDAPRDVYVCREELFLKVKQANLGALAAEQPESPQDTLGSSDVLTALSQAFLSRQAGQEVSPRANSGGGSSRPTPHAEGAAASSGSSDSSASNSSSGQSSDPSSGSVS